MKKLYILLLAVSSMSFGQTFYSENMGTPSATTAIALNVFQNPTPIIYTGTADVRSSLVSTGYTGASGSGNVFLNADTEFFQIDGLNSSAYNAADIQLSFGINTPVAVTNLLTIEQSTNGGTSWTAVTYTPSTIGWSLVTIPGGQIPSSATLSLRFTSFSTLQFRVDDVKLSSVSASCTLVLGTPTTLCDLSTLGADTYTVTIPYTGAGNAAYTVSPSMGTVGGDNPTTTAVGNITVSGVTEGIAFSTTVTGGTCNFTTTANSPECKPVNTLPYGESFSYTIGNSLGAEQKWTNVNSGDNILVASGSLNYPGQTSTGNSIAFSGAGIDCFSPFTATTSGTIYASFILNVTDLANVTTDLTATYFAGLTDDAKGYNARLFIRKSGTQYQLGLDTVSTTTNYDATLRNVGDIVYVVMGYDFATNTLNAWINPNISTFTASTTATLTNTPAVAYVNLGGFILRQDGASSTPSITLDELRVADTTGGLLTVKEQNSISGLKVYPNPVTNGNLFITSDNNEVKQVLVYDVLGNQVIKTSVTNQPVNVASLTSGVYMVKVTEAGKTATRKLVIR